MDRDEILSKLKDVITSFIKDDPETMKADFHDVFVAKAQNNLNGGADDQVIDPTITSDDNSDKVDDIPDLTKDEA